MMIRSSDTRGRKERCYDDDNVVMSVGRGGSKGGHMAVMI